MTPIRDILEIIFLNKKDQNYWNLMKTQNNLLNTIMYFTNKNITHIISGEISQIKMFNSNLFFL